MSGLRLCLAARSCFPQGVNEQGSYRSEQNNSNPQEPNGVEEDTCQPLAPLGFSRTEETLVVSFGRRVVEEKPKGREDRFKLYLGAIQCFRGEC